MVAEYYDNKENPIHRSVLFLEDKGYLLDVNKVQEHARDKLANRCLYRKPNPFYATPVGLELLKLRYPGLREYL